MTAARGLAFELSQLPSGQRERLLCELPADRRAQMEALLQEVAGMLHAPAESFERHLAIAAAEPATQPLAGLNDGQLRLLMSAEHSSVQRRIAGAVRSGHMPALAPAVATVVTEYLSRKLQTNEIRSDEPRKPAQWWRKWKRT